MIFQYGKTYRHTTGSTLRIVGVADTHMYGKCLVGEIDDGTLIPIDQGEADTKNYTEVNTELPDFIVRSPYVSVDKMLPCDNVIKKIVLTREETINKIVDRLKSAFPELIDSPKYKLINAGLNYYLITPMEYTNIKKYYKERNEWGMK